MGCKEYNPENQFFDKFAHIPSKFARIPKKIMERNKGLEAWKVKESKWNQRVNFLKMPLLTIIFAKLRISPIHTGSRSVGQ